MLRCVKGNSNFFLKNFQRGQTFLLLVHPGHLWLKGLHLLFILKYLVSLRLPMILFPWVTLHNNTSCSLSKIDHFFQLA